MEELTPCPVQDREVFRRVWERVMAGRSEERCPVDPAPCGPDGDVPCACLEVLARGGSDEEALAACLGVPVPLPDSVPVEDGGCPADGTAPETDAGSAPGEAAPPLEEEAGVPGEVPAPEPPPGAGDARGCLPAEGGPDKESDLPHLWEEPQEAADRTGRLRREVMEALEGWQFYRLLAKRARGNSARQLNALAGEEHRAARKLAAAYFLLTGLRYWPSELLGTPAIPSYWGALRARHQAEQRQENDYRIAGDDWEDPDMTQLYQELAEGCQCRCRKLRAMLEEDGL